jgi:hypothetical protein
MLQPVPTSSQYRTIAARLQVHRDTTAVLLQPIRATAEDAPFGGGGGRLERTVHATIAAVAGTVVQVVAELQVQIDEANRRAAWCDWYDAAVRDYYRSPDPNRVYPRPPASWVDHG